MKVLYLTTYVLGDPGANAADIFPRLAAARADIDTVIVADFPRNKYHIETRQGAEYLRLERSRTWLRHAARIARFCKAQNVDILHIFYRQQNAMLLILIRLWCLVLGARVRIVMDHRSVNLAKGWRCWRKKALNLVMQACAHHLAGNPGAVETNHFRLFRPVTRIDLGYDTLPPPQPNLPRNARGPVPVWFVGTLKPRNRKSEFLFDVFEQLAAKRQKGTWPVHVHVAGPTHPDQATKLRSIPGVTYHGKLPRKTLYRRLQNKPGLGLAYMNREFHEHAPSLKFAEYASMRFGLLASDTAGLRLQAHRMRLPAPVRFIEQDAALWAQEILQAAAQYTGPEPIWHDAAQWSYASIFDRQVLRLYKLLTPTGEAEAAAPSLPRASSPHA